MRDDLTVILAYYYHPCTEAVLENVFAKELGKVLPIRWLLRSQISYGKRIENWNNSEVRVVWAMKGSGKISKIINKLTLWLSLLELFRIMRGDRVKIVLIRDMPVTAIIILLLKFLHKSKVYYQCSAPIGEMKKAMASYKTFPRNIIVWSQGQLFSTATKYAVSHADIVFAITEYHKKSLSYKRDSSKIVALTMGVDRDWLERKQEINKDIEILKNDGKFIITYFGTLSFLRDPQMLFYIFAEVKKTIDNSIFIIMGKMESADDASKINKVCNDLGIKSSVIFTGYITRYKLQDYLRYCDLSISYVPAVDHYIISSPTKLYESLGNGVPVVANKGILEQDKVIAESGGGVLVDSNVHSFSSAIVGILNNKEMRNKMSASGKEYILNNYTYQNIAAKILPYFKI